MILQEKGAQKGIRAAAKGPDTHHLISKKIEKALEGHKNLKGKLRREDPRLKYPAADKPSHNGYERWHRDLDGEVVAWLEARPDATEDQFIEFMQGAYSREEIAKRKPGVDLGDFLLDP